MHSLCSDLLRSSSLVREAIFVRSYRFAAGKLKSGKEMRRDRWNSDRSRSVNNILPLFVSVNIRCDDERVITALYGEEREAFEVRKDET